MSDFFVWLDVSSVLSGCWTGKIRCRVARGFGASDLLYPGWEDHRGPQDHISTEICLAIASGIPLVLGRIKMYDLYGYVVHGALDQDFLQKRYPHMSLPDLRPSSCKVGHGRVLRGLGCTDVRFQECQDSGN